MEPRLSLITLGVTDMARARVFYEAMGWTAGGPSNDAVTFFQGNGLALGLYGRDALAEDGALPGPMAGNAVVLAHNVRDKAEVDRILDQARAAGGTVTRPAEEKFWGGYSGYFTDPDGHAWEIAWNPFFPIDDDGNLTLGG